METKGFAITLRQHGSDVGYVVDVSAGKAKGQTIRSVGDVCGSRFTDITSCRRVSELDGRPVTTHPWATIESVPR